MSRPLEHDYIGLTETSSSPMERSSEKISSSTSSALSSTTAEEEKTSSSAINLKETELRLGLPGSHSPDRKKPSGLGLGVSFFGKDLEENNKPTAFSPNPPKNPVSGAKRGFSDAIDGCSEKWVFTMSNGSEVDVGKAGVLASPLAKKEVSSVPLSPKPAAQLEKKNILASEHAAASPSCNRAQVVGWPPIRSFRKNSMASNLAKNNDDAAGKQGSGCLYVKVSMDGAPYLRKVDLKTYNNYTELSMALEKMFSCFTIGQCSSNGLPERDGLSASRLMDLLNGSEFVLTFEDKDDDWMLVGDVPWQMFTETCRRLRIMKGSETIGLAPRAAGKCKNRN
ncbi:auxin-responsive protein IAA21 isoform X1 [Pyrus x bretschneideri]|uniref:auxin-responsive protein IAA21 isoform X1 n=1 Tax=Pyrus x bretschneideri TaxID=225117 RepID=UPI00202FBEF5|nr:auxin-responsive protein IAA21 isoform X1 [Pyrus x bretschneideri]